MQSHIQSMKDFHEKFWLLIFVEGTRFTSKGLLAAQQYAASKGLPTPRNVLVPRVKVNKYIYTTVLILNAK